MLLQNNTNLKIKDIKWFDQHREEYPIDDIDQKGPVRDNFEKQTNITAFDDLTLPVIDVDLSIVFVIFRLNFIVIKPDKWLK